MDSRKKKVAAYFKISIEFCNTPEGSIETIENKIRESLKKETPKGWVPITPIKFRTGRADDDFMYNMRTTIGQQFIIKAPRIVSKKYHKNKLPKIW